MALDLQARGMAAQVQTNLDEYIETFKNGMKFVGISSTDPLVSGATVSGYSDWAVGNIVLYNDKEYLLTAALNIAANWIKFGEENNPFSTGAGHDSAVLVATPNEADPSVDRTNTVTGDFSAVLAGSRNNISATESAAVGGIINIEGGGNNLGAGYRQTLTNCENGFSNGYRNTATNANNFIMTGRENAINAGTSMFISGRENTIKVGHTSGNPQSDSSIVGGRYNNMEASYSFIGGGQYNDCYNDNAAVFGYRNFTSRQGQLVCGNWNKANDRAYFVVGSGFDKDTRKNCFAAGWYSAGATEEDRRVIWVGDTMISEKQFKQLLALLS